MKLQLSKHEQAAVISVIGSVDALTAAELTSYLNTQVSQGNSRLVLDLGQVDFMSSAGLRAILATLKEARQKGGDLRIAAAQPGIEKVLKMSGFTNILKAFSSSQEALASFAA